MDKDVFLTRLFLLFPPRNSADANFDYYNEQLNTLKGQYDWHKALMELGQTRDNKSLPTVKELLNLVSKFKIGGNKVRLDGEMLVVLENGRSYQFTICNVGDKTKDQLMADIVTRFDKPKKVLFFPAGTVIIAGEDVCYPSGERRKVSELIA